MPTPGIREWREAVELLVRYCSTCDTQWSIDIDECFNCGEVSEEVTKKTLRNPSSVRFG